MLTSNHCFDFSHYYKFGHFDMQRCLDESYKYIKISLISNSNPSKFKKKKEYMIRSQYSRRDKLAGFDEQKENAPDQASALALLFTALPFILFYGHGNQMCSFLISSFLREKIFCLIIHSSCNFNGPWALFGRRA